MQKIQTSNRQIFFNSLLNTENLWRKCSIKREKIGVTKNPRTLNPAKVIAARAMCTLDTLICKCSKDAQKVKSLNLANLCRLLPIGSKVIIIPCILKHSCRGHQMKQTNSYEHTYYQYHTYVLFCFEIKITILACLWVAMLIYAGHVLMNYQYATRSK